jgi:peptidylprolyl isomerase
MVAGQPSFVSRIVKGRKLVDKPFQGGYQRRYLEGKGSETMIRAMQGDTVKVSYTGRLADGTIFDASTPERPLHFILGKKEVIAGFDQAVTGMYMGESRTVTIPAEQAYGPHEAQYVETVERSMLPAQLDARPGQQLEVTAQNGNKLLVLVAEVTEETITLDGNHPLAGKELIFDIELLEVHKTPPGQADPSVLFSPPK